MKWFCLLILSITICLQLFAQKPPMKWSDVPKEDLEMTVYEKDPDANAVVLCNYADVVFDISERNDIVVEYQYHKRIKILKKAGFEEANINLYYNDNEEIVGLNAQVVNFEGGKPKKTKLAKEDFFKKRETEDYQSIKFVFPEIKEGSIIEYKYTLKDKHVVALEPWYFQEAIPTIWSEMRIVIPEGFEYVTLNEGGLPYFINEESTTNNEQASNSRYFEKHYTDRLTRQSKDLTQPGALRGTLYRKVVKEAPAMIEEDFITAMENYYSQIRFQLKATYFNGLERTYFTVWESVAKALRERDMFGVQVKNSYASNNLTDQVPAIIAGAKSDKEKAEKVFKLVSNAIKWDKSYGIFANETINKATKLSIGNSAAINLGLIACLKAAGLEASPLLISTRRHGKHYPMYPFVGQFNQVLAVATIDGKKVPMDATNPDRPYNVLSVNNLNGFGLIPSMTMGGITEWIEINPAKAATSSNLTIEVKDDKFHGHTVNSYIGYDAVYARKAYHKTNEDDYLKTCLGDELDYTVEEANFRGHKENANRFVEDLKVTFDDLTLTDKIYLSPLMLSSRKENPFKLKERNYPVDIAYPRSETFSFKFIIPEGYNVVEMPESIKLKIPDGTASYHYFIEQNGNSINVLSKLKFSKTTFLPEEYTMLKQLFEKVIEKHNEQIVLSK